MKKVPVADSSTKALAVEASPPPFVTGLTCFVCGRNFPYGNLLTCPDCGIQGILDVRYDEKAAFSHLAAKLSSRPLDHWRYREMLPLSPDVILPNLHVGWTPVYDVPRLAGAVGVHTLTLKDDGRNPTNSFKDRASSVGVMKAMEFGFDSIACASTGNAASSLAGFAAAVGLKSFIFVPQRAPEPKVTQLLVFGATVVRVEGTYENAFDLCRQACEEYGWYNRNSGTNPYLVEGKKTAGLEIGEQMAKKVPDWVVVPVGDGCTIGGIGKGLEEMKRFGFIDRMPRLLGVQARGSCPIVEAFQSGRDLVPGGADTVADSIAVGTPRNWRRAIRHVKASHGAMAAVADEEILESIRLTARFGGVFGEPAGVTGIAGLRRAVEQGIVGREESALVVVTGNGLKDIQSARRAAGEELRIPPTMQALAEALSHTHSSLA